VLNMGSAHAMQIIKPLHVLLGHNQGPQPLMKAYAVQLTSVTEKEGWRGRLHGLNTAEPL